MQCNIHCPLLPLRVICCSPQNSTTQAVSGSDDCLADKNSNRGESKSLVTIKYYVSLLKLPFQSSRPKIAH